jgi:hypothetical protein
MRSKKHLTRKKKQLKQPAYPDPETWRKIVAQRGQILRQFLLGLAEGTPDIVHDLVNRYGAYQVRYVLEKYQEYERPSFLIDEPTIYRQYRWLFAQFGGDRPFLSRQGYDAALLAEMDDLERVERMVLGISGPDDIIESDRLVHLAYATDITPPAVPPKPADFEAPAPQRYSNVMRPLLKIGWRLDESALGQHLSRLSNWRSVLPELSQMATDPGLVNGWPGEKASWAPYHALILLGRLQDPGFADGLMALIPVEDDWLSDLLPGVWAQMGPAAAAPLWRRLEALAYGDDKLAVLVAGLLKIAQSHPDQSDTTVSKFINLLDAGTREHIDLNAYIAFALDELGDAAAAPSIQKALDEDRVNERIVGPDGLKLLGAPFGGVFD